MAGQLQDQKMPFLSPTGSNMSSSSGLGRRLMTLAPGPASFHRRRIVFAAGTSPTGGDELSVDVPLDRASSADFDALLLPGGVINPDSLRIEPKAVAFVKSFFDAGKPVAAICHGPWTIINAGAARGRRMTSWPSLEIDLRNAGAQWVDQEAVTDQGLVTSRKPADIPAFNRAMIDLFRPAKA